MGLKFFMQALWYSPLHVLHVTIVNINLLSQIQVKAALLIAELHILGEHTIIKETF